MAAALDAASASPYEIPVMTMEPCSSDSIAIGTRLVNPSASVLALSRVPSRVHADRPLEVMLFAVGLGTGAGAAVMVPMVNWISAHAVLQLTVDVPGEPREEVSVLVEARPSGGGWIARALALPALWSCAVSVTVVSLSLAGRLLPCDCLPATLRVGYNHAPAPAGAVLAAGMTGDVPALRVALDADGSTEEADEVRGG